MFSFIFQKNSPQCKAIVMTITPGIFFSRSRNLFLIISLIQVFHLIFVSKVSLYYLAVWFILFMFGFFFFVWVERFFVAKDWPYINKSFFSVAFFVSFFVTLVFSRFPYVESYVAEGMYLTRQKEGLGSGGWYSFFAVFFYPLSMILAIIDLNKKKIYLIALFIVLAIDIFVLGTRGAPIFVVLFHALFLRRKYSLRFLVPMLLISSLFFVVVFTYQTESRSSTESYEWHSTVKYSRLFDNLPVKDLYVEHELPDYFYVSIYISQYITHSVSEFSSLLQDGSYDGTGSFNYFLDEVCLVAMCDRSKFQGNISDINSRSGLYQTLYSSLLFDFGYFGLVFLFFVVIFFIYIRSKISLIFLTYLSMVVAFSLIDNYIYNAIGMARFFIFVGLFYFLSFRYRLCSRSFRNF